MLSGNNKNPDDCCRHVRMCVYGRYAAALANLFPAVVDAFTTFTILALRFCSCLRPLLKVIVIIYS